MGKANYLLAILNAACVPMNLGFYVFGSGHWLNLVAAIFAAVAATYCFVMERKMRHPYGDGQR